MFPRLYAIIDAAQAAGRDGARIAEALLGAGVTLIQYRDKTASSRQLYDRARQLRRALPAGRARLIINDRADVALAAGADGVHVGQQDLPVELARRVIGAGQWVGCSTHNLGQVRAADASSCDYIAFGPIFPTASKHRPDPAVGIDGLREARQATGKPLVAIGGITLENCRPVIEAGANAVAVISHLLEASDIGQRAREFLRRLGEGEQTPESRATTEGPL